MNKTKHTQKNETQGKLCKNNKEDLIIRKTKANFLDLHSARNINPPSFI